MNTRSIAPKFRGTPNQIKVTTTTPIVGSAILLNEGSVGHVGLVFAKGPGNLTILESNGDGKSETIRLRHLAENDPKIRGYYEFPVPSYEVSLHSTDSETLLLSRVLDSSTLR